MTLGSWARRRLRFESLPSAAGCWNGLCSRLLSTSLAGRSLEGLVNACFLLSRITLPYGRGEEK